MAIDKDAARLKAVKQLDGTSTTFTSTVNSTVTNFKLVIDTLKGIKADMEADSDNFDEADIAVVDANIAEVVAAVSAVSSELSAYAAAE